MSAGIIQWNKKFGTIFFELAEKKEDFYLGKMYRIIDRIYGILVVAQEYNNI